MRDLHCKAITFLGTQFNAHSNTSDAFKGYEYHQQESKGGLPVQAHCTMVHNCGAVWQLHVPLASLP